MIHGAARSARVGSRWAAQGTAQQGQRRLAATRVRGPGAAHQDSAPVAWRPDAWRAWARPGEALQGKHPMVARAVRLRLGCPSPIVAVLGRVSLALAARGIPRQSRSTVSAEVRLLGIASRIARCRAVGLAGVACAKVGSRLVLHGNRDHQQASGCEPRRSPNAPRARDRFALARLRRGSAGQASAMRSKARALRGIEVGA